MFLKTMASSVIGIAFPERVHRRRHRQPRRAGLGVLCPCSAVGRRRRRWRGEGVQDHGGGAEGSGGGHGHRDIRASTAVGASAAGRTDPEQRGDPERLKSLAPFATQPAADACPSASMSSCWRDEALERELWKDAAALNVGVERRLAAARGRGRHRGEVERGLGVEVGGGRKPRREERLGRLGRRAAEAGTGTKGGGSGGGPGWAAAVVKERPDRRRRAPGSGESAAVPHDP